MLKQLRLAALAAALITPIAQPVWAQSQTSTIHRCSTVEGMAELRRQNPEMESDAEFERKLAKAIADEQAQAANGRVFQEVLQIPVVFHIMHTGQALGTGINIPDVQVYSQLRVLNEDFRRKAGTRGFNADPRGADTRIEFVLAKRDPNGLPTTGIEHISVRTLGINSNPPFDYNTTVQTIIKPRTGWDPTRYFNVWVTDAVTQSGGLYGIAQFPTASSLEGMQCAGNPSGATTDGVLISPVCTGSLDDGNFTILDDVTAYGRTLVHETGHWLGLRHIWGDASCGNDYCEDTPVHATANNTTCPTHPRPNSCGTADEMFENYMDYTNDRCMNIFTTNQMQRMRAVLKTVIRRRELLTSDALQPVVPFNVGLVEILSPLRDICAGTTSATVAVKNFGSTALTGLTIGYRINGGAVVSSQHSLNLAAGAQGNVVLTGLNLPAGQNTLTIWTSQPNGQPDTLRAYDTLSTVVTVGPGQSVPAGEAFESNDNLPTNWSVVNNTGDCKQWRLQSVAGGPAGTPSVTASFGFFQNNAVATLEDYLVSPVYNLSGDTSAYLIFNLAHQRTSAQAGGTLRVDVSTDCGLTWQLTPVFSKTGAALSTVTTTSNSVAWYPTAAANWRRETINLHDYAGQSIRLRFVTRNTGGNNLFIDNVLLARTVPGAPVVTRFAPDSGAFGSTVTVYGRGFAGATAVAFNGVNAGTFQVLTDSSLTANVPTGSSTGPIRVTTSFGQGQSATNFTVLAPPVITSFNPVSGAAGRAVTITGTGFDRVRRIYFNGTPATLNVVSSTQISTVVPAGATTGRIAVVTRTDSVLSPIDFFIGDVYFVRDNVADTACSGLVVSPGYPGRYSDNQEFVYRLYAPPGQQIRIQIQRFRTEVNFDYLRVYDGPATTNTRLAQLSGTVTNRPTYTSTNGVLTLRWTADQSNVDSGFVASIACILPPPPTVTAMSPRQGPIGYEFGLTGTNLLAVDTVWFGSIPVTTLTKTATSIIGIVPPGAVSSRLMVRSITGRDTTAQTYQVTEGLAYCRPAYAACGAAGLRRVAIPRTTLASNTACTDLSGPAFTIYPMRDSATGTLLSGGNYLMRVGATNGQNITAWLDYDRDGAFEASELLTVVSQPTSQQPGIVSISVPAGLDSGMIGLRVRARTGNGTDPCTSSNNGSGADFTLTVRACPTIAAPTTVIGDTICAGDTASISAPGGMAWWFAQQTGGNVLDTGSVFNPVPTATATYYVANTDGVCLSTRVPVTVDVNPAPVADFTATVNTLMATAASQAPGYSYQWYFNGQPIPGATALAYVFSDTGTYALEVTTSAGCTTRSAGQLLIPTGTRVATTTDLRVVPNPSSGRFQITSKAKATPVRVLDATGRTVWSGTLNGTLTLDLGTAGKGLYLLTGPTLQPTRLVVE